MKRILLIVPLVIIAILLAGCLYQLIGSALDADRRAPASAPGQIIEIDGVRMHLHCTGKFDPDRPTILLESGWSAWSTHWSKFQSELQTRSRVCSYDRRGYGWSDVDETIVTGTQVAESLDALLQKSDEKGPFVLVGHSLGSMYARTYAQRYPKNISVLVLIDAGPPGQYENQSAGSREALEAYAGAMRALPLLTRLGITRLTVDDQPAVQGYEGETKRTLKALLSSAKVNQSASDEYFRFDDLVLEAELSAPIESKPILIVNASDSYPTMPALSSEMRTYGDQLAANLSDEVSHLIVPNTDHFELITNEDAIQIIASEILKLAETVTEVP